MTDLFESRRVSRQMVENADERINTHLVNVGMSFNDLCTVTHPPSGATDTIEVSAVALARLLDDILARARR